MRVMLALALTGLVLAARCAGDRGVTVAETAWSSVPAAAADTVRTSVDPVGTDPSGPADHGFFGWWRDSHLNYGPDPRSGLMRVVGYAAALFTRYYRDPLFVQAQWGLRATPMATGNFGVGKATAK